VTRNVVRRRSRMASVLIPAVVLALASGVYPSANAAPISPPLAATPPSLPGYGDVAPQKVSAGKPLPQLKTKVKVDNTITVASRMQASGAASKATPNASAATTTAAATAAVAPQLTKVGVRALVIALDTADFGLKSWTQMLDGLGASYDVLYARTTPLTIDLLVRADGAGKYNAILLTNSSLLYQDATGAFVSGFTGDQWNTLWAYERDYKVRQSALYTSYGTFPEDYCLTGSSEGGVGDTPLPATLTAAGATPFSYLKSGAQIPIVQSYVYRTRIGTGCNGTAMLTNGADVLGVRSTSADGRERMALTFTTNENLLQAQLLPYGLFRWASQGLFLGEQRHYLNVDVDDWFNQSDLWVNGAVSTTQTYSGSGHDAYNAYVQQSGLRAKYPLATQFTMGMAFNGEDANLTANSKCSPKGDVATLTATSKCLRNDFRWINHTLTHPKMNFTDLATNTTEISQNLTVAATLGLPVDKTVLKTPEYSGLGVYNPNVLDDISPPTDFGIMASNQALLDAAANLGVKYLHGNMSFASHRPSCFNCGLVHPMKTSLTVVPDWPTNIAYFSNNPASETSFYNYFYGPAGKFPYYSVDQTYSQVINAETEVALRHLASGSVYTHTFHIPNLQDYGSGKTLLTDWADSLIGKYSSYYSVPLQSPAWPALATYTTNRNAHFATAPTTDAVYDSTTNTVSIVSTVAGKVQVTGARTAGFTTYGSESSSLITLAAGTPVTFTAFRLP